MVIAVDTNCILPGQVGGIENYTCGLIEALQLPESPAAKLILLTRPENQALFSRYINQQTTGVLVERQSQSWAEPLVGGFIPNNKSLADYQRSKAIVLQQHRVDLLHCPGNTINPLNLDLPIVLNLHDLQHRHFPQHFSKQELDNRDKWWVASAQRADAMLAASNFVRDDLVSQLKLSSAKIHIAPDPVEAVFSRAMSSSNLEELRKRLHLPDIFFLYPAACWPHKNHQLLINAFAAAKLPQAQLVLTGGGQDQLLSEDLPANVRLLGRVSTDDLIGLYHLATAMIFPSQHESWSIPIAEAMACGCPVACSNVTSLPEQLGDAGILFSPGDPAKITKAICTMAENPSMRRIFAMRGRRRAKQFTKQTFLAQVTAAYHYAITHYYSAKAA